MATQTVSILAGPTGRTGLNLLSLEVAADAGLTEKWLNTGFEFLEVSTVGTGTTLTELYNSTAVLDGQTLTNRAIVIGTNARLLLGPYPTTLYNDTNGFMNITWSSAATVKLAVFRLTPQN